MKTYAVLGLLLLAAVGLGALEVPFHRGVNLTEWYQAEDYRQTPVGRFGPVDFERLKGLGVDGVRVPVNFLGFVGPAPQFALSPVGLALLDRGVDGLLAAGLTVVLDNHSDPTDPRVKGRLEAFERALWRQLSAHYRDRGPRLLYEFQNEPHEISAGDWDRIQRLLVKDLRLTEPDRLAVVTGADWGGISGMLALPRYDDPKLIYSFHFYDPFMFTHQGADWAKLDELKGVAFPPRGPAPQIKTKGEPWWRGALADYYRTNAEAELAKSLDQVKAFAADRKVPVWCGEFGVYNKYADPADRAVWYRTVAKLLGDRSFPWTMWDYRGGFGLFQPGSAEDFDRDLLAPVVEGLGFTMPPQLPPLPRQVTRSLKLYQDSWDEGQQQVWLPAGAADLFDENQPGEGLYSLRLANLPQYGSVTWGFAPAKDLSALAAGGVLSFLVRANQGVYSFDVRFVDAAAPGTDNLPWRSVATITQDQAPGDGAWHRVTIPLARLTDGGAWDGTWHDARAGAFDWTRVGAFQIVAERAAFGKLEVGIDDLKVVESAP